MNQPDLSSTDTIKWEARFAQLPSVIVWGVILFCLIPAMMGLLYPDFIEGVNELAKNYFDPETGAILQVPQSYVLFEWSAFCIALFTAILSLVHYKLKQDLTTAVICVAIFFSGMLDGFQVLAATGITLVVKDPSDFIPLIWTISRFFNIGFLIAGIAPFVWKNIGRYANSKANAGTFYMMVVAALFILMAFTIVDIAAGTENLPRTVFDKPIPRPWDMVPLVLYLAAGALIFPKFHRMHPSLFSHGLLVSVIPHIAAQTYASLGSRYIFDYNFNAAHYLKIVAYAVPLTGLILDYIRVYKVEVVLQSTKEKLKVARRVQQALLPTHSPDIPGFDLHGMSVAADAVGGDYFDYIHMDDKNIGIVVADVSGHELGAAILMAKTRAYLRALAQYISDVGTLISKLNHFLVEDVVNRWFVTMFFVRLNIEKSTMTFSANGHQAYLFRNKNDLEVLDCTSPPLGVIEDQNMPCSPEITLKDNDILLILTDGVTEAINPEGEYLGMERLKKIVHEHQKNSAEEIINHILEMLNQFRKETPLTDDITVVVLKKTA
jgi:phosphoserine phosphatase RsbU/P